MNLFFYVVVIPATVYIIGSYINRRYNMKGNQLLLIAAALLFSISLFFPSPLIHGQETQFWTHFFGGGVFMGLLFLYFRPLIKRDLKWYEELAILFMLVCAFGVINELYELFIFETGLATQVVSDTSYDLLANTLGALAFYIVYRGINITKRLFISR